VSYPKLKKAKNYGMTLREIVATLNKGEFGEYTVTRRQGCFAIEQHGTSLVAVLTPEQFVWLRRNKVIRQWPEATEASRSWKHYVLWYY
jgi:hypothetical protein